MTGQFLAFSLIFVIVAACASTKDGAQTAGRVAKEGAVAVAELPLHDLNITREEIPPALSRIDRVYPEHRPQSCFMVHFEIRELDAVLGPDEDDAAAMAETRAEMGLAAKAAENADEMAIDAIKDAAASQIPFRDLVRRATGARAHARKLAAAYDKGEQRRTYLKGLGDAMGCEKARVKREFYAEDDGDDEDTGGRFGSWLF